MQKQKSILSFFQKPSPVTASKNVVGGDVKERATSLFPAKLQNGIAAAGEQLTGDDEVRGTVTPPEKVPRQVLPETYAVNGGTGGSLFSSIRHKFVRVEEKEDASQMNQGCGDTPNFCLIPDQCREVKELSKNEVNYRKSEKDCVLKSKITVDQSSILGTESNDDILGPGTPGTRPLVPRLKRPLEQSSMFRDEGSSFLDSTKRLKPLVDPFIGKKKSGNEMDNTTSKFEWLDPSQIKDAKGRRPGDPLYDKRSLYIPPDALKKMSASQKQYWGVKCQYMDIVLFFKVGKFYELYELDAEIGHKELDWKMTISGVGKCRQVGISESGIDDAVQKLVARGYKVGRIEQLETSEQAKVRGANSVIPRKLIQVITPSTSVDGNIGPDAVHLLAIKEGNNELENGSTVYGFAFVDCAALKFWVGSINDDSSCAVLGALLMQVSPKEIIYENRGLSRETQKALQKYSLTGSSVQLTPALSVTDFVDSSEMKNMIQSNGYFKGSSNSWTNTIDGVMHQDIASSADRKSVV